MSDAGQIQQRLVESGLISASTLRDHLAHWRAENEGRQPSDAEFLKWLVEKHVLTDFQRDALLSGHAVPSFLVGPYRVYEMVAVGSLGGVFRAVHKVFDQPVSLKLLAAPPQDEPETLARIRREARVALELHHPNVVNCLDVGRVAGQYYVAFEDLQGETLAARLERDGYLPFVAACRVARDVALGLAHLHQNDVIHRDLRPENIWLAQDGPAKIMEFSAAHDAFASLDTDDGQPARQCPVLEDYTYIAPELVRDPNCADKRSDLYALGCVLYDCLAGRPPFKEAHAIRQVVRILCDEPEPVSQWNEDVPEAFDDTLAGLLAKRPEDRFQKAKHVAIALDQFLPGEATEHSAPVVEVSPQYLEWVRCKERPSSSSLSANAVGVTPELTDFLEWMTDISTRKEAR